MAPGEGDSVAAKKKSVTEKQLKGEVKNLRAKLERADAKAERWKKRARENEKAGPTTNRISCTETSYNVWRWHRTALIAIP